MTIIRTKRHICNDNLSEVNFTLLCTEVYVPHRKWCRRMKLSSSESRLSPLRRQESKALFGYCGVLAQIALKI